ncbi:hypothetical protein H0H93_012176 [Arthromyces matolae]|nr:hypothetical protein H0H93_012176 [Arthromyces matolae]
MPLAQNLPHSTIANGNTMLYLINQERLIEDLAAYSQASTTTTVPTPPQSGQIDNYSQASVGITALLAAKNTPHNILQNVIGGALTETLSFKLAKVFLATAANCLEGFGSYVGES